MTRQVRIRSAWGGTALVGVVALFALAGPLLSTHDPLVSDFQAGASLDSLPVGPCRDHLLGTDRLFRDMFARLAHGARASLAIGIGASLIATTIGSAAGIIAGYTKGSIIDTACMRIVDVGLGFPFLLAVMALGSALDRTTPITILLTLGLLGWTGVARIVRAKTMIIASHDYVLAATTLGQSPMRIIALHIFPNVLGTIGVVATLLVGHMILAESVLSYLGAGISPPTPTWGHMLHEGQDVLARAPWIAGGPAILIMLTVLGFNLLGEGLRDAFRPDAR